MSPPFPSGLGGTDGSVKVGPSFCQSVTLKFQTSLEASVNAPMASHSHAVVMELAASIFMPSASCAGP